MLNRRRFLGSAARAASITAAFQNFPYSSYAAPRAKLASDIVTLGPRKLKLSRMAMGTGTNGSGGSSLQTRSLGVRGLADLLRAGADSGVTFWDTADQYGSHPHVREALKAVKREKVTLLTKTHAHTHAEMQADFDRYRRELNTDYIDIMLLHFMTSATWPEERRGAMDFISEAQEKGLIKTKGVSCHTMGALKAAANSEWVEVDLARINPAGVAMDADPNTVIPVLKEMKGKGKGIIGMKILGAGQLAGKADECLQYALASEVVDCFTIGAKNVGELNDLIRRIPAASTRG